MKTTRQLSLMRTNARCIFTASIVCALTFTACGRRAATEVQAVPVAPTAQPADPVGATKTVEISVLGLAIDRFEKTPTVENRSTANLAFAKLDVEIAELRNTGNAIQDATH